MAPSHNPGPTRSGRGVQTRFGEGYDELQQQVINERFTAATWNPDGDGDHVQVTQRSSDATIEPAGGLARDEVAELVAVQYTHSLGTHPFGRANWNNSIGDLFCRSQWELSTEPDGFSLFGGRTGTRDPDFSVEVSPEDTDVVNSGTHRIGEVDDAPGIILHEAHRFHSAGSYTDANLLEATGFQRHVDGDGLQIADFMNFRHQLGGGPVFDRHDRLFSHKLLAGRSNHLDDDPPDITARPNMKNNLTLYWDVALE